MPRTQLNPDLPEGSDFPFALAYRLGFPIVIAGLALDLQSLGSWLEAIKICGGFIILAGVARFGLLGPTAARRNPKCVWGALLILAALAIMMSVSLWMSDGARPYRSLAAPVFLGGWLLATAGACLGASGLREVGVKPFGFILHDAEVTVLILFAVMSASLMILRVSKPGHTPGSKPERNAIDHPAAQS